MGDETRNAMKLPTVSVVTPTYRRHPFLEQLLRCVRLQDYPQSLIEVVILDDSPRPPVLRSEWTAGLNVRVVHSAVRVPLGEKRNRLHRYADGEVIVCFDDDDWYPPQRVSHAVEALQSSGLPLAGSSLLPIWFTGTGRMVAYGPYGPHHSCNGALAYTSAYARRHKHDGKRASGEEPSFTANYTAPMVQLDAARTMLAIAHPRNTVAKDETGDGRTPLPNLVQFPGLPHQSWRDWVTDEDSRAFYRRTFDLTD